MAWAKRILLFVVTNLLVVLTISIILSVLGIRPGYTPYGIDYGSLMAFCLVWGMGGALISLGISRIMAKMAMGVKVIPPETATGPEGDLLRLVHRLATSAGLPAMPQVGIYDSPEVNAFATGPTRARALVAVSSGLLRRMNRTQIEGVLGHEIAHVANGDMVTMTLLQGVVNAFVMFLARVIAFAVGQNVREESRYAVQFAVIMVLQIVLGLLGAMVVAWFSRAREFRADAGGAQYAGRGNMISALQALQSNTELIDASHPAVASLKISSRPGGFMALLSTHPPLETRIARLQQITG